jgi:hypothetical protein
VYTREDFLKRWHARRDEFTRVDAVVDGAKLLDEILADASRVFAGESELTLTLDAAARSSGYSKEHLARLVRNGTIPNAGRRGAPRIAVHDVPARTLARPLGLTARGQYNPSADARAIRQRLRGYTDGSS